MLKNNHNVRFYIIWLFLNVLYLSGLKILPLPFFHVYHWIAPKYVIADKLARTCYDVGKLPLGNIAECQEAASSFGFLYRGSQVTDNPKGCYIIRDSSLNFVYWNNHGPAFTRNLLPICKAIGKCRLCYWVHTYQMNKWWAVFIAQYFS